MKKHILLSKMCQFATICILFLFCLSQAAGSVRQVEASGSGLSYHGKVSYGGTAVGNFTIDGKRAFCLEHRNSTPPSGTAFTKSVYQNPAILKALYYGWGGEEPWSGFTSEAQGIVCTSLVLSYYYSGPESILTLGGGMDRTIGISAFMSYLNSRPVPNMEFALSKSAVTASLSADKAMQQTEDLTLKADSGNRITLSVPADMKLYNRTTGVSGTGKVTVKGGDTFYLTAPLTKNGVWNSGVLTGSKKELQTVVAVTGGGYQNLSVLTAGSESTKTIQLSVKWVSYGDIDIRKFTGENEEIKTPAEGVEFTLTHQATKEKVVIVTNAAGCATTKGLESGTYPLGRLEGGVWKVEETKEIEGHKPIEPFTFTVSGQGNLYEYYIENYKIKGAVNITKVDKETGKPVLVPGTEFKILDEKKEPLSFTMHYPAEQTFSSLFTAENGRLTVPEKLAAGTYYLQEVKAPSGYMLEEELIPFTVDAAYDWEKPFEVTSENMLAKGVIQLTKTEEGDDGRLLSGAEYDIVAAETVKTPDGTIRAEKGAVVEHLVTDEYGKAQSKELYLGTYEVKETKAPPGYALSADVHTVELVYQDQVTPIVYEKLHVTNRPTEIRVLKVKAGAEGTVKAFGKKERRDPTGAFTYLEGVEFRIWNKAVSTEETDSQMNAVTAKTNEKGYYEIRYLHPGTYCIQEVKALPGYLSDDTIHEVTVDEHGRIEEEASIQLNIENEYTKIEISKLEEETKKPLAGAGLSLRNEKGKEIAAWTSEEQPHRIECLESGTYVLSETEVPKGYERAKDMKIIVKETKEVQSFAMYDKKQKQNAYHTPVRGGGVKTGDDSSLMVLILFAIISCFTIIICGKIAHRK